jgi:hypothetical protein
MNEQHHNQRRAARARLRLRPTRRGIASVLAMMFLVIFGSLAATMGIVAQGNLRTAQTHLQVSRALAAAEAGLIFAERRFEQSSRRFVCDRGEIDEAFAEALWLGTYGPTDGTVLVRDPVEFDEMTPATGIAEAIVNAHVADAHQAYGVVPDDDSLPYIDDVSGAVVTCPISFESSGNPSFQLIYEPLADHRYIRVTSIGRDQGVERVISVDYLLAKRLRFAILSPNRIMLGKNVHVEGRIGSSYDTLNVTNGHPIVTLSDFWGLSSDLDSSLEALHDAMIASDVDGDGRLRIEHSVEGAALPPDTYDADSNGYLDEFDLFIIEYDDSYDAGVCYDSTLAADAGRPGLSEEFTSDLDLCQLMDQARPDRNNDGVVDDKDVALGYNDGVVDRYDSYAKIDGSLGFSVDSTSWETFSGQDWQELIEGPITPDRNESAVEFEVDEDDLMSLDLADFTDSQNDIVDIALAGAPFQNQVDAQNGTGDASYSPPSADTWERMPYRSPGFYDWYQRPVYRNMTFKNVTIPMGNNGLFVGCTFIGATHVETFNGPAFDGLGNPMPGNTHPNWNYYGTKEKQPDGTYVEKYDVLDKEDVPEGQEHLYTNYDELPEALYINGSRVRDTKVWSNNLRFHDCEFRGSVVTNPTPTFTHVRNKLQFTGQTVFHEPSQGLGEDDDVTPEEYDALKKSSLMAPGYSVDMGTFNSPASQDINLRGTIISGVMDIRGNASIFGSLLMTYRPVEGSGALVFGGNPANFNSTFGYFGPDDGDGESIAPANLSDTDGDGIIDVGEDYDGDGIADPWEGYGKIRIVYDPNLDLPDGLLTPIEITPDPLSYKEGR